MDIKANGGHRFFPMMNFTENGTGKECEAHRETAARRKSYITAYNFERDNVMVNNLPHDRLRALESHISIMHALDNALAGEPSQFSQHYSELSLARERQRAYSELLEQETDYRRSSWTTQGWNVIAGANGFLQCFALGTLTSNALGKPWLVMAITPLAWMLTERVVPMIRATSWRNKHADVEYPLIARVSARAVQDRLRSRFGLHVKKYLINDQTLTASQYRQILSLFNAWKGKVATDDLPFFFFSLYYSLRHTTLALCTTAEYLKSDAGRAVSIVSLGIAGILAGGSTYLAIQASRRYLYRKENPDAWRHGEIITKSPCLWGIEKDVLEAKIKLLELYKGTLEGKKVGAHIDAVQAAIRIDIYKAGMKSKRLTSIVYEISCLLNKKSASGEDGFGEAASTRIDALCGLLGKAACLVPAVLFNQFVAQHYTGDGYSASQNITIFWTLNTLLIIGFSFRKELEFPWRYLIALVKACCESLRESFGYPDKYVNNDVVMPIEICVETNSERIVEESDDEKSSEDFKDGRPMQMHRADQTNPDGVPADDETSSETS